MMNSKRNRGGRTNSGRPDKRQIYQDRQQRPRGPVNKNVYIDGVYRNQRFTHVVISLVGTTVQVQVKNGKVYEGILKTVSNKGDTVLEMAHVVEDNVGSGTIGMTTPSRDRIVDKLIIEVSDLVAINAANVDLEYAVKDAFTDTGISKFNGEVKEKEMRELQPWEADGGDELGSLEGDRSVGGGRGCLEGDRSNGWDAHEMFHTNASMFNVKSSYDESLGQYTTKLNRDNSEEWRRREEEAARLAAEIERSEQYKKHIALENGEGDEEAAFSSVVRPGDAHHAPPPGNAGGPGKYIPPNKRSVGAPGMSKPGMGRGYAHPHQQNAPPPMMPPPMPQQQQHQQQHQQHQQQQPIVSRSMSSHRQSPPVTQTSNSQSSVETVNVNGEKSGRPSIPVSTAGPTIKTSSPVQQSGSPTPTTVEVKHDHNPQYPPGKPEGNKKSAKGRDEQIKELKEFSSNFKLDDNKETKEKDKEKDKSSSGTDSNKEMGSKDFPQEEKDRESAVDKMSEEMTTPDKPAKALVEEKTPESESLHEKAGEGDNKQKDIPVIKSNLNPNAIVFTPKSFPPKQSSQQIPTPPRPQTQSPIIQQAPMMAQPVYPAPGQQYIMPPNAMVLNNQPAAAAAAQPQQLNYNVRPKRAVVSVKPDYTASAVQAVSGQPLLAQSAHQSYMYIPSQMMPPQPTGYQMGQMMPMPSAQTPTRFMTPTSMQGMPPTTLQTGGLEQQNTPSAQTGQMYMTPHQQGPMPAHINPASHLSHPNHMNHINMSNNTQPAQSAQINPPPGPAPNAAGGHHHPAPSPVLNNPNQQPMNSGPHPPSSGTPQPPQGAGYPQATLQAPPLQPSPHNPTSPQNMQPMPYAFNTSHPLQMQSSGSGQQFTTMPAPSSGQSSVTYSMHSHQSPHMQQIVMMPPQMSASGQINHPHHIHGSHQFQGHPMAGPGSMQQQLMSQPGVQNLHSQNPGQGHHPQQHVQHFLPQVHNAGGQPVQSYQPSQ